MSKSQEPRENDGSQADRFIKAAREAGCSEDESVFDEALRQIAKAKPKKANKTQKKDDK